MTENGTCPPSPSLPQHPETPPDPPVELPDEQIDPEPALPPGAIRPPPPEIGSHNYTFVLEKVQRQLGFRLDRQLVDNGHPSLQTRGFRGSNPEQVEG